MAGAITIHGLRATWASDMETVLKRPNQTALVTMAISLISSQAVSVPPDPTASAIAMRGRTRRSVVKSPGSRRRRAADAAEDWVIGKLGVERVHAIIS